MRDSLSALDQVRAFAGDAVDVDDVVTVLGLVGRDLVFDILEAVASEDAPAAFALVDRAIERGYDLRQLCRELARATRDLLVLSVDPSRAADADLVAEGERARVEDMVARWSREDLLRGFDLLIKAEQEIKLSDQPRYSMEMALLRLMHLRKLVPLAELLGASGATGATGAVRFSGASGGTGAKGATGTASSPASRTSNRVIASAGPTAPSAPPAPLALAPKAHEALQAAQAPSDLKDRFLREVKSAKGFFYNTVVAHAYRIDVDPARITFTFLPNQKVPRQQCDEQRRMLEEIAEKVAGKKIPVTVVIADGGAAAAQTPAAARPAPAPEAPGASEEELRQQAMADPTVQALFEIFPVEKAKIEEI
jgi:DNA polymerase III gamma/tau subunit